MMKNQSDELVAPKYDETDEQRKKMETNSKMKDETYNEEIDKCEENKIFKLFPGIEKSFFIILVYFIRLYFIQNFLTKIIHQIIFISFNIEGHLC